MGLGRSTQVTKVEKLEPKPNAAHQVNTSNWFLIHTETIAKEFQFLEAKLGFTKLKSDFVGHEHWTVYEKDEIKIEIWGDPGDLPFVCLRNTQLSYDESKRLDNRDSIEAFNPKARQLKQEWSSRRTPIRKRFMDNWSRQGHLDLSELNEDYTNFGQKEHEEYLREAAKTVRENFESRKGVLKYLSD